VIEDIFELQVPRLQITRSNGDKYARNSIDKEDPNTDNNGEEEKKLLRREIKSWWEGVADHMDKLVSGACWCDDIF
jgi:1-phosphatidylinositol-3-phosphate 5-kinase